MHVHYAEDYREISAIVLQLRKLLWKRWKWANPENYVKFHKLRDFILISIGRKNRVSGRGRGKEKGCEVRQKKEMRLSLGKGELPDCPGLDSGG